MKKNYLLTVCLLFGGFLSAYAQNKIHKVESEGGVIQEEGLTLKRKVAIGRFSNETQYGKGIFYNKEHDPMAKQAQDLLMAKLASSGKFLLLERDDLSALDKEVNLSDGNAATRIGADYLIIGSITEFGRKTTGKSKMFSKQKKQEVEAAISIRIADVYTGMIIFSDESSGSAELTTKTTMGLGGRAGYDATLSDKAISAAIDKMVENIIIKCTDKPWRSYFLNFDKEDGIFIAGGESQGITEGTTFLVKQKGKMVKNPQTGLSIELPSKVIGKVVVDATMGDTPETELSVVTYTGDPIQSENLSNYYIEEEL